MSRFPAPWFCILVLMLWLHGCGESTQSVRQVQTSFSGSSGLTVTDNSGKSQQLIAESLDVRAVVSPSAQWIAVEDMQLSDLVVIRVFRYHGNGYQEVALPEIRRHWEALAHQAGIAFEDLLRPRIGIEAFGLSEKTLLVHFRAEAEPGGSREIDSVEEIPLERNDE